MLHLPQAASPQEISAGPSEVQMHGQLKGRRVLVAEDNPINLTSQQATTAVG